jgi:hypothetical protein
MDHKKKQQNNAFRLALDLGTRSLGFSVFKGNDPYSLGAFEFKSQVELVEKARLFKSRFFDTAEFDEVLVESAMMGFQFGLTNSKTMVMAQRFAAMIEFMVAEREIPLRKISVLKVRSGLNIHAAPITDQLIGVPEASKAAKKRELTRKAIKDAVKKFALKTLENHPDVLIARFVDGSLKEAYIGDDEKVEARHQAKSKIFNKEHPPKWFEDAADAFAINAYHAKVGGA